VNNFFFLPMILLKDKKIYKETSKALSFHINSHLRML
jgi:hypothetical protein